MYGRPTVHDPCFGSISGWPVIRLNVESDTVFSGIPGRKVRALNFPNESFLCLISFESKTGICHGGCMFKPAVLFLAIASCACAQTPQELLRLAQDTYRNPDGYEIKGRGFVQPPGSSWRVSFDMLTAAAPSPFDTPRPPAHLVGRVGGKLEYVNVLGGTDEKPAGVSIPFVVAGSWDRIAENVDSVTETGRETLPLNG